MMIFSPVQAGQVYRITYPALVPLISGFKGFFVMEIIILRVLFMKRATMRKAWGPWNRFAKKVSKEGKAAIRAAVLVGADLVSKPFEVLLVCRPCV